MPSASSRARPPGFRSRGPPPGMMTIGRSATGRSRPRQQAAQSRVMQEYRLLHERHDGRGIRDRVAALLRPVDKLLPELARQPLRLAPGQLERRVLGPVPIAPPGQIVAAQGTGVVLELGQVEPAPIQDQQVHLVPLARPVPELQVRPRFDHARNGAFAGSRDRTIFSPSASRGNCEGVTSIQRWACGATVPSPPARPDVPWFVVAEEGNPASHPRPKCPVPQARRRADRRQRRLLLIAPVSVRTAISASPE